MVAAGNVEGLKVVGGQISEGRACRELMLGAAIAQEMIVNAVEIVI